MTPGWKEFEEYANNLLGLRTCTSSGNKFYDPGDGSDHSHTPFPLLADSKYTERGSFSVKAQTLRQWVDRAHGVGKRFIMPLRFSAADGRPPHDYVLLTLDDFAELVSHARAFARLANMR